MELNNRFIKYLFVLLCTYMPCEFVIGATNGFSWPTNSVLFHIGVLNGEDDLWKEAFEEGAKRWNDVPTAFKFLTERTAGAGTCTSTGNNSAQFSSDSCGDVWGSTTLATTSTKYTIRYGKLNVERRKNTDYSFLTSNQSV